MMISDLAYNRLAFAAMALVCAGGVSTAHAQSASAWEGELHAAARLIGGATLDSGQARLLRAGLEIRLDPGWKTYWRYPGDSGVPPTLDFSGSENVKSVTALWPAPERFSDGAGGHSIGYLNDVVLPLRIVPKDGARASSLRVKLGYAVCGSLCVPAEANLRLPLSGKAGAEEPHLVTAEARVPRRVPLGAVSGTDNGLAVRSVHRETGGVHERVIVEVTAPKGTPVDLFVEGPTADWALPLPEPQSVAADNAPELQRFTFDLDGLPPGAVAKGAALTFTAVSPTDAIEVQTHLD
jgi:DsbC/DsbD-like thiol-disulfide interchange protein